MTSFTAVPRKAVGTPMSGGDGRLGGAFTQMGEGIFQFRFSLVLALDDIDHVAADQHHGAGRQACIGDRGNDQIARNGEGKPRQVDVERAADMPQHGDERRGGQN